jgi:serine/threonine-protein kinase
MPLAPAIDVGSQIGDYRVTGLIGEGGMGTVYLAEQAATGRQVAVKMLQPGVAWDDVFRRRFERESRYAAALDHPNIVRVHEVGELEGQLYMVMDYIAGADLHAEISKRGPLDPARATGILASLASALDSVHEAGLYHRDVKPANVIVTEEEPGGVQCHLTDFGLTKDPRGESRALTLQGQFVGTSNYTAPEQILGKESDHRVDIYSLGCLLYECLTGEPPFRGPGEEEVLRAHLGEPPPKPSERQPGLPRRLDEVVARAMAKDPEERYPTCAEMVRDARAASGADAQPRVRLQVTDGNAAGTEIFVDEELVIGRNASEEGTLAGDLEISRRHARVRRSNGGFVLEDLGSTNGTFLNGQRIGEPRELAPGDTINVGSTTLVVEPGDAPAPATEAPDLPPLDLRLRFDPRSGEVRLELEEGADQVRLVHEGGRWRFAPRSDA